MSIDELEAVGVKRMSDGEIAAFLDTQDVGVLGLPAEGPPYMLPLSFSYDGEDSVHFSYLLGETSEKETLSERAESARFLVFDVEGTFTWESVLLTGTLATVPEGERAAVAERMDTAWRPAVFEDADLSRGVELYRLSIAERSGVKHVGLPPELEREYLADEES